MLLQKGAQVPTQFSSSFLGCDTPRSKPKSSRARAASRGASLCVFPRAAPVLCVSIAAVCGVVVWVVGREPDYISTAARKRDEPAWRVCPAVRAFPLRGGRRAPLSTTD